MVWSEGGAFVQIEVAKPIDWSSTIAVAVLKAGSRPIHWRDAANDPLTVETAILAACTLIGNAEATRHGG